MCVCVCKVINTLNCYLALGFPKCIAIQPKRIYRQDLLSYTLIDPTYLTRHLSNRHKIVQRVTGPTHIKLGQCHGSQAFAVAAPYQLNGIPYRLIGDLRRPLVYSKEI